MRRQKPSVCDPVKTTEAPVSLACCQPAAQKLAASFCRALDAAVELDAFRSIMPLAQVAGL
jgi:hypothetical protein